MATNKDWTKDHVSHRVLRKLEARRSERPTTWCVSSNRDQHLSQSYRFIGVMGHFHWRGAHLSSVCKRNEYCVETRKGPLAAHNSMLQYGVPSGTSYMLRVAECYKRLQLRLVKGMDLVSPITTAPIPYGWTGKLQTLMCLGTPPIDYG